ncbi:MAG: hypothetical protein Q9222_002333 [Ikaeria aurantiellina]
MVRRPPHRYPGRPTLRPTLPTAKYARGTLPPTAESDDASETQDKGKWSAEWMYSTDSALLGVRGLYNFGPDPRVVTETETVDGISIGSPGTGQQRVGAVERDNAEQISRFSAGAELYYGLLNKSGGMSTGVRFATLPAHTGFPYTMTLTLNPLMGNLSSSYSVWAGELLSLSTRFGFNVYSYESEVVVGMELWKMRGGREVLEENTGFGEADRGKNDADIAGCLKARVDQRGSVGLLWEGRVKELVYSCGANVDLKGGKDMISGVGLEVQYSS